MSVKVAVISPGAMGASIGAFLARRGAMVFTDLDNRGAASVKRAEQAGMTHASKAELMGCEIIISIVPPAAAESLSEEIAALYAQHDTKPLYMDCNAINPETLARTAANIERNGGRFVDASIIGGPAQAGQPSPLFFVCGPNSTEALRLKKFGLRMHALEGPNGRASAVKMAYGGLTKGLTALGCAMILGGIEAGVSDDLHRELKASRPQLFETLSNDIPKMFSKAGRWVAEMEEISGFLGEESAQGKMFEQIAALYRRIADETGKDDVEKLRTFFTSV